MVGAGDGVAVRVLCQRQRGHRSVASGKGFVGTLRARGAGKPETTEPPSPNSVFFSPQPATTKAATSKATALSLWGVPFTEFFIFLLPVFF